MKIAVHDNISLREYYQDKLKNKYRKKNNNHKNKYDISSV